MYLIDIIKCFCSGTFFVAKWVENKLKCSRKFSLFNVLIFSQANFSCFYRRCMFSSFTLSHLYHTISLYMFESAFSVCIISFVDMSLSVIKFLSQHQLHLQDQPKDSSACGRMWKWQWSRDHWALFEKLMRPQILVNLSPLHRTPVSKFILEKICAQNPQRFQTIAKQMVHMKQ